MNEIRSGTGVKKNQRKKKKINRFRRRELGRRLCEHQRARTASEYLSMSRVCVCRGLTGATPRPCKRASGELRISGQGRRAALSSQGLHAGLSKESKGVCTQVWDAQVTHTRFTFTHTQKWSTCGFHRLIPSPTAHTGSAGTVDSNQRG